MIQEGLESRKFEAPKQVTLPQSITLTDKMTQSSTTVNIFLLTFYFL